jgi:hypothetical protein
VKEQTINYGQTLRWLLYAESENATIYSSFSAFGNNDDVNSVETNN